jgi:hypothetical protein
VNVRFGVRDPDDARSLSAPLVDLEDDETGSGQDGAKTCLCRFSSSRYRRGPSGTFTTRGLPPDSSDSSTTVWVCPGWTDTT